MMSSQNFKIEQ